MRDSGERSPGFEGAHRLVRLGLASLAAIGSRPADCEKADGDDDRPDSNDGEEHVQKEPRIPISLLITCCLGFRGQSLSPGLSVRSGRLRVASM